MLIKPFPSVLRQALLQLWNAELGMPFSPASSPCPKQLENCWKPWSRAVSPIPGQAGHLSLQAAGMLFGTEGLFALDPYKIHI